MRDVLNRDGVRFQIPVIRRISGVAIFAATDDPDFRTTSQDLLDTSLLPNADGDSCNRVTYDQHYGDNKRSSER